MHELPSCKMRRATSAGRHTAHTSKSVWEGARALGTRTRAEEPKVGTHYQTDVATILINRTIKLAGPFDPLTRCPLTSA